MAAVATAAAAGAGARAAGADQDRGQHQQGDREEHAQQDYGFEKPLARSSDRQVTAEEATARPTSLVTLAKGLKARVVATTPDAQSIDMLALFPNDSRPTHILACNEAGTSDVSLIRVTIATGAVENLLTSGTQSCDGVKRTPWGTFMFSEEAGGGPSGGRVYELIDPLGTPPGASLNRSTGVFTGPGASNYTPRPALGRLSFEGLALYPNGVVYFGDENRPSSGKPGGAYFKFVPSTVWSPGAAPITSLSQSPLAGGTVYGLRLGLRAGGTDYGQATQTGFGKWITMGNTPDLDLRAMSQAPATLLTGYYRPEDLDVDQGALARGQVRFCGNNTGNEGEDQNWGEAVCITDGSLADAAAGTARPELQFFAMGHPELAMPDNMAYQPGRGNWIVQEDGDTSYLRPHNNDLWDCLPDGGDDDVLTDGCVRMASLNDLTAEWTGGIFDASGRRFFVSVQHNISERGVLLEITGF
jgi:secreted PhoX family phosphatase